MKTILFTILTLTTFNLFAEEIPKPQDDSPIIADPVAAEITCGVFMDHFTTEGGSTVYTGTFSLNNSESDTGFLQINLNEELGLPDSLTEGSLSVSANTAGAFLNIESPHIIIDERHVFSDDADESEIVDGTELSTKISLTSRSSDYSDYVALRYRASCKFQEL